METKVKGWLMVEAPVREPEIAPDVDNPDIEPEEPDTIPIIFPPMPSWTPDDNPETLNPDWLCPSQKERITRGI